MKTHSVTVIHSSKRAMLSPCSCLPTSAAETAKARFLLWANWTRTNFWNSKGHLMEKGWVLVCRLVKRASTGPLFSSTQRIQGLLLIALLACPLPRQPQHRQWSKHHPYYRYTSTYWRGLLSKKEQYTRSGHILGPNKAGTPEFGQSTP